MNKVLNHVIHYLLGTHVFVVTESHFYDMKAHPNIIIKLSKMGTTFMRAEESLRSTQV